MQGLRWYTTLMLATCLVLAADAGAQSTVTRPVPNELGDSLADLVNPLLAAFVHVASEMSFVLNSARLLPVPTTRAGCSSDAVDVIEGQP